MTTTHGHCIIHPLFPLTSIGGMLKDYRKISQALGRLLKSTHRGTGESTDALKLVRAQGGGQAERRGRSSRQWDCKVEDLVVRGAWRKMGRENGSSLEMLDCWCSRQSSSSLSSTLPCLL